MLACRDTGAHQCSVCKVVICGNHELHGAHLSLGKTELTKIISLADLNASSTPVVGDRTPSTPAVQSNSTNSLKRMRLSYSSSDRKSESKKSESKSEAPTTIEIDDNEASEKEEDEEVVVINRSTLDIKTVTNKVSALWNGRFYYVYDIYLIIIIIYTGFCVYDLSKMRNTKCNNDLNASSQPKDLKHMAICIECYSKFNPKDRKVCLVNNGVGKQKWDVYLGKNLNFLAILFLFLFNYLGTDYSTSKLSAHITSCHPQKKQQMNAEKADSILGSSNKERNRKLPSMGFSSKGPIVSAVTKWVVMDLQPISVVENKYFRDMMSAVSSNNAKVISRHALRDDIEVQFHVVVQQLKGILKEEKIAITLDTWTSIKNETFIGMQVSFINQEFELVSLPLTCEPFDGGKDHKEIFDKLMQVLRNFEIKPSQVSCLVTDNEPTMNLLAQCGDLPFPHAGCIDHLLNLVSKLVFNCGSASAGSNTMLKARELVAHINHSSQKGLLFKNAQVARNETVFSLIQDVATRWWSTYLMISRLNERQIAITRMVEDNYLEEYLETDDWEYLKNLEVLLEPFKYVQEYLEGEKYVTNSSIPQNLWLLRLLMKDYKDALDGTEFNQMCYIKIDTYDRLRGLSDLNCRKLTAVLQSMIECFENRFGEDADTMFSLNGTLLGARSQVKGMPVTTLLACCLDPRTKNLKGIPKEKRASIFEHLKIKMEELKRELLSAECHALKEVPTAIASFSKRPVFAESDDEEEERVEITTSTKLTDDTISNMCETELSTYNALACAGFIIS